MEKRVKGCKAYVYGSRHLPLSLKASAQSATSSHQSRVITLAKLLALDSSSYFDAMPEYIMLDSQSVSGPRLFRTGGIICRLSPYTHIRSWPPQAS